MNALAHVVVTEGLTQGGLRRRALRDRTPTRSGRRSSPQERNSPEATESITGVPAERVRDAARLYASAGNGAIYYGLGVTEHSQGTTTVMCIANLAMATGNLGREGVGVNPLRGQNNVQGSCDMGSFPHEFTAYRHVSDPAVRGRCSRPTGACTLQSEPGLRIPNMFEAALDGTFKGMYVQGEDFVQSDPNTHHVSAAMAAMECVVVQDLFLNETAKYAHVFLPGSSFLEKDGTFTNAERRVSRVRKVMRAAAPATRTGRSRCCCRTRSATRCTTTHPREIMEEIARLTPTFTGAHLREARPARQHPVAVHGRGARGHPDHARATSSCAARASSGRPSTCRPASARTSRFPLILTTGRILSAVQRRRADAPHQQRRLARRGRARDPSARRGGARHQRRRLGRLTSRAGETVLRAQVTEQIAAGCRLHDLPLPRDQRQRGHDRELGLGDQLPGVQGHRGRGGAGEPEGRLAEARRGRALAAAHAHAQARSGARVSARPERSRGTRSLADLRRTALSCQPRSRSSAGSRGTLEHDDRPRGRGDAGRARLSRRAARRDAGDARRSRGLRGRLHAERGAGGARR